VLTYYAGHVYPEIMHVRLDQLANVLSIMPRAWAGKVLAQKGAALLCLSAKASRVLLCVLFSLGVCDSSIRKPLMVVVCLTHLLALLGRCTSS
jgi:hypothetical protein